MGRRAFIADLSSDATAALPNIASIRLGADGEDFTFEYRIGSQQPVTITVIPSDMASYPENNRYYLSASDDAVQNALDAIQESLSNITISDLFLKVSSKLAIAMTGSEGDPMEINSDDDTEQNSGSRNADSEDESMSFDDEAGDDDEEEWFGPSLIGHDNSDPPSDDDRDRSVDGENATILANNISRDLKRLRTAGFRVGVLKGMLPQSTVSILSISYRISKLGLPDEVLEAWNLRPAQYIVLAIRYGNGYVTLDDVQAGVGSTMGIRFRLGLCNRYKPTLESVAASFSDFKKTAMSKAHHMASVEVNNVMPRPGEEARTKVAGQAPITEAEGGNLKEDATFGLCFLSSPLRELMDDMFLGLVKTRLKYKCGWESAKNHVRLTRAHSYLEQEPQFLPVQEIQNDKDLPQIIMEDHLIDSESRGLSLPLVAMQFALLYLVKCTDFCLVCHKKASNEFGALKPYVCSDPLCLYQYMALGFGPAVEHEILTQPYVVDLLVSFCYSAAAAARIRELPNGMGLRVPSPLTQGCRNELHRLQATGKVPFDISDHLEKLSVPLPLPSYTEFSPFQGPAQEPAQPFVKPSQLWKITCNVKKSKLVAHDLKLRGLLKVGDWVMVDFNAGGGSVQDTFHCKVLDINYPDITITPVPEDVGKLWPPSAVEEDASCFMQIYDSNFDDMSNQGKSLIICELLRSLPSIKDMVQYLTRPDLPGAKLRDWTNRISPAALGLLRWIIASNRSCIVQVDRCPLQTEEDPVGYRPDQKLTGMDDYVQFRFAQGAPDKEAKFHDALAKAKEKNPNMTYPSIFAWHGSAVFNWHSIIRQGLDFRDTLNGRAYGHGVYHALEFEVSLGYSGQGRNTGWNLGMFPHDLPRSWPRSSLGVQSALCLNEIVNMPNEFVSSKPYIVVQYPEWIQCRYLLVKCGVSGEPEFNGASLQEAKPKAGGNGAKTPKAPASRGPFIPQDPAMRPARSVANGVLGTSACVEIPRSAFPSSRNFAVQQSNGSSASNPKITSPKKSSTSYPGSRGRSNKVPVTTTPKNVMGNPFSSLPPATLPHNKKRLSLAGQDEYLSEDSDIEDIKFFIDDQTAEAPAAPLITDFAPGSLDKKTIQQLAPPDYATSAASRRLQSEIKDMQRLQKSTPLHELGWYMDGEVTNLYQWIVELHSFPLELPLAQDMKAAGVTSIVLEIRFGADYPMSPPFVRVVRPRFLPFFHGGGGHVTAGGALCMELLSNNGWSAVNTIESVLLQVRMAIMSTDPRPARLDRGIFGTAQVDYGVGEAIDAYERACRAHGWSFPDMRGVGGKSK